jgi:hypothetical protein
MPSTECSVHFVQTEPTLAQCQAWRRLWQILLNADLHPEAHVEQRSLDGDGASWEPAESHGGARAQR